MLDSKVQTKSKPSFLYYFFIGKKKAIEQKQENTEISMDNLLFSIK